MRFGRLFERYRARPLPHGRRRQHGRRRENHAARYQQLEDRALLAFYYHGISYPQTNPTSSTVYFNYEVSVTDGTTLYARYEAATGYVVFNSTEDFSHFNKYDPSPAEPNYSGTVRSSSAVNLYDRVTSGDSFAVPVSVPSSAWTFPDPGNLRVLGSNTFICAGINIVSADDATGSTTSSGAYNNHFVLSVGQQLPVSLSVTMTSNPDISQPDTSSILLKSPTETRTPLSQVHNLELSAANIELQAYAGTGRYRARDSVVIKSKVKDVEANVSDGNFVLNAGAEINGRVNIRLGFSDKAQKTPNFIGSGGTGGDIIVNGKIFGGGNSLLQVNSTSKPCNILTGPSGSIAGSGSLMLWNAGLDGGRIDVTTDSFASTAFQAGASLPNSSDPNIAISVEQLTGNLTVEAVPSSSAAITLKADVGKVTTTSNIVTRGSLSISGGSLDLQQPISTLAGPIALTSDQDVTLGSDVQAGTLGVGDLTIQSKSGIVNVTSSATVSALGESIRIIAAGDIVSDATLVASSVSLVAGRLIAANTRTDTISASSKNKVTINEDDELSVKSIDNSGTGGVTVTAGGRLEVSNVSANAGDINLTATSGGLLIRDEQSVAQGVTTNAGSIALSSTSGDVTVKGLVSAYVVGNNTNNIGISAADGNIVLWPTAHLSVPKGNFDVTAPKGRVLTPGNIDAVTVDTASTGEWYDSVPAVSISSGSGASAAATLQDGHLTNVKVVIGGSGYTGGVAVQFVSRDGNGQNAAAMANVVGGVVTGIVITNPGQGYTQAPEVRIVGTGSGAMAEASIDGVVAIVRSGSVDSNVIVTGGGTGYEPGKVQATIAPPPNNGVQATATVALGLTNDSLAILSGGNGYATDDMLTVTGGGGTGAVIKVTNVQAGGIITGFTIERPGSGFTSAPTGLSTATGSGAGATITGFPNRFQVVAVTVINSGSGYNSDPVITINGINGGVGTGAQATATVGAGSGYQIPPQVVVISSGDGGTTGPISVDADGQITSINVSAPGNNYLVPPTVQITPAANTGSGARATAKLDTGVGSAAVTTGMGGSGYSATTGVTFAAPTSQTGVAATGVVSLGLTNQSIALPSPTNATTSTGANYRQGDLLAVVAGTGARVRIDSVTNSGAVKTFTLLDGGVNYFAVNPVVTVLNPGSGFTGNETVTFPNPNPAGGPAGTGTPQFGLSSNSLTLSPPAVLGWGSGFVQGDTLIVTPKAGGVPATYSVTGVSASGGIMSVRLVSAGRGFTNAPTNTADKGLLTYQSVSGTLPNPQGNAGYMFTFTPSTYTCEFIAADNTSISGFTSNPTVSLSGGTGFQCTTQGFVGSNTLYLDGGSGTGAQFLVTTVNAPQLGTITPSGLRVTNGGTGYTAGMILSHVGGTGGLLQVTTNSSDTVISVRVKNPGSGYRTAPSGVVGGSGSGAAFQFNDSNYQLVGVQVVDPGKGYAATDTFSSAATGTEKLISFTHTGGGLNAEVKAAASKYVSGITVTNPGSGYDPSQTTITLVPVSGGGAAASGVVMVDGLGQITGINLATPGGGYVAPPTVTITDASGSGRGAAATASMTYGVTDIAVTNGGSGYDPANPPTVTIANPKAAGGRPATARAVVGTIGDARGVIQSLKILTPGSGYIAGETPQVTFSTGSATATGTVSQIVSGFRIVSPGIGYNPATTTVDLTPIGEGATAFANVANGAVTSYQLTASGSNYKAATPPNVSVIPWGTGATATASIGVGEVTGMSLTHVGTGYLTAPRVTVTEGTGASFRVGSIDSTAGDGLVSITPTSGGSGYPDYGFIQLQGNGGSPGLVQVRVDSNGGVTSCKVIRPGGGFQVGQNLTHTSSAQPAEYTAVVSAGSITGFTQVSSGSGYTSTPAVTLTGGGGSGATAVALVGGVKRILVTNPGAASNPGYSVPPGVSLAPPPGPGLQAASATASLSAVAAINAKSLSWTAMQQPLDSLVSQFNTIACTLTASGDIVLSSARDLTVTKAQTLDGSISITAPSVTLAGGIVLVDQNVSKDQDITIHATVGNVTVNTQLTAPRKVSLRADTGAVTSTLATPGLITAPTLTLDAYGSSKVNTKIDTLDASVRNPGQNLNVTEADQLNAHFVGVTGGAIGIQAKGKVLIGRVVTGTVTPGGTPVTGSVTISASQIDTIDPPPVIPGKRFTDLAKVNALDVNTVANLVTQSAMLTSDPANKISLNSISLVTAVDSLSVASDSTVAIADLGPVGLNLTSVVANGAITVDAKNALTATLVTSISNTITLTTYNNKDVTLGSVTASGNSITITADGAISDATIPGGTDITATSATLTANGGGITVDLDVSSITAKAKGDITLTGANSLTLKNVASTAGTVDVQATSLAVTSVTAAQDVKLTTTVGKGGTIDLGTVAASDTITVLSDGNITDADRQQRLKANAATLTSTMGSIVADLDVATVKASATKGDITLYEKDGLVIDGITSGTTISLTLAGPLTQTNIGAITGTGLSITNTGGAGAIDLTNIGNDVSTLAIDSAGSKVAYTDKNVLAIGIGKTGIVGSDITVTTVNGSLTVTNAVTGSGDVSFTAGGPSGTITGAGTVSANLLTLASAGATLATKVASLDATITGTGSLAITEADAITLGGSNAVTTAAGSITVAAGGAVTVAKDLIAGHPATANDGDVVLEAKTGDLTIQADVRAELDGITLKATGGKIVQARTSTIVSEVLEWYALRTPQFLGTTTYQILGINLTGSGDVRIPSVSGTQSGTLILASASAADGNVVIDADAIVVRGLVKAGGAGHSVKLYARDGGILFENTGRIDAAGDAVLSAATTKAPASAANIDVQTTGLTTVTAFGNLLLAANIVSPLSTAVASLDATITGTGSLAITEADAITLGGSNAVTTAAGSITVAAGGAVTVAKDLIAGGPGNVSLTATGSTITGAGTVSANLLTLASAGATLATKVASLDATITGTGSLAITEADAITLGGSNAVTTAAGSITIVAGGAITVAKDVSAAGSGSDVTLEATGLTLNADLVAADEVAPKIGTGGIAGAGRIRSGTLRLDASTSPTHFTNPIITNRLYVTGNGAVITASNPLNDVNELSVANPNGSFTFVDVDDVRLTGVTVGSLSLTLGGSLTQDSRPVIANSLAVTATTGNVALASAPNEVGTLAIVNTGRGIDFKDRDGITIASLDGDNVALATAGDVTQTGVVKAASFTLTNGTGNVSLASTTNDVGTLIIVNTGRGIAFNNRGGVVIGGLDGAAVSLAAAGDVTQTGAIRSQSFALGNTAGSVVLNVTANSLGRLSIFQPTSLQVANAETLFIDQVIVTGAVTIGVLSGDLRIGPAAVPTALLKSGTSVNLVGVNGRVVLENGGRIEVPSAVSLPANQPLTIPIPQGNLAESLLSAAISQANSLGLPTNITIAANANIQLSQMLPAITAPIVVVGANVSLLGSSTTPIGFQFQAGASGSVLSGVTFRGFTLAGVSLDNVQMATISSATFVDCGTGIMATGNLTGTRIISSAFSNNTSGITLTNAKKLTVGGVGVGNQIRSTARTGTGLLISGNASGTTVLGNAFSGYSYAIRLQSAAGVTVGGVQAGQGNLITSAARAGVFATGICPRSQVIKNRIVSTSVPYYTRSSRSLRVVR